MLVEYVQQYAMVDDVKCCAHIQQHQSRHKTGVSGMHDIVMNDCNGLLSRMVCQYAD